MLFAEDSPLSGSRSRLPLQPIQHLLSGSDSYFGPHLVGSLRDYCLFLLSNRNDDLYGADDTTVQSQCSYHLILFRTKWMHPINTPFINLSPPDSSNLSPITSAGSLFSNDVAPPPSLLLPMPMLLYQPTIHHSDLPPSTASSFPLLALIDAAIAYADATTRLDSSVPQPLKLPLQ